MTIEEAIKVLDILIDGDTSEVEDTWMDAVKLSREALKGIKKVRKTLEPYVTALLPGETEK